MTWDRAVQLLQGIVPAWNGQDDESLGKEGQRVIFTALALSHGLASHSGATLGEAYRRFGPRPTLLERDFNLPPLDELLGELDIVRSHLSRAGGERRHAA